jgi:hypothetical protein
LGGSDGWGRERWPAIRRIEGEDTMTHSSFSSVQAVAALILLTFAGCRKASHSTSDNQVASLLFDVSSPAAREALATPVDFRLTD